MAKPIPHGTNTGYTYHKCRCEECKAAHTAKGKKFREANPDYYRSYREDNAERLAEYKRQWMEGNPGYRRRSWESNRERDAEKNRLWREANPDYRRRYYEANREKPAEDLRLWREAHPERLAEHRNRSNHLRRARRRGAFVEDVPRLEIFERDNWQCMIPGCLYPGIPASLDVPWPDPLFASIDHVIPLSKDGLHERANLTCAHLRCNMVKKDRIEGIA